MFLDITNQFASAYAPTAEATTTMPFYIDRLAQMDDGKGQDLIFYVRVAATATSGGAATVQFNLIGNATDPSFSSGNIVIITGQVNALGSLVAGFEPMKAKFPRTQPNLVSGPNMVRYLTGQVIIGGAALTAGSFDSWLTPDDPQDNLSYPRGYVA